VEGNCGEAVVVVGRDAIGSPSWAVADMIRVAGLPEWLEGGVVFGYMDLGQGFLYLYVLGSASCHKPRGGELVLVVQNYGGLEREAEAVVAEHISEALKKAGEVEHLAAIPKVDSGALVEDAMQEHRERNPGREGGSAWAKAPQMVYLVCQVALPITKVKIAFLHPHSPKSAENPAVRCTH